MSQASNQKSKGFWGNTFTKLKSALSKTKEAVVDSVLTDKDTEHADLLAPAAIELEENTSNENKASLSISAAPATSASTDLLDRAVVINSDYLDDLEDKLIRADLRIGHG